jgi:hypothetical protein
MANSLTAMSPTFWSKIMGKKLYKTSVFRSLASFAEQATLEYGLTVDRPYRSDITAENYTKGTAATAQDLTASSDTLTINKQKTILMYVDDVDKYQNKWDAAKIWAEEAAVRLNVLIDGEFFYEYSSAADTIDDGDIGGTAGNGITVTSTNIPKIFAATNRKLDANNVPLEDRFFAISPQFKEQLWLYIQGKESLLGDKTSENGNIGRYAGLELFLTNNLSASARWIPADNPTTGATITINGITFTFEDTIGTTAGNVHIGSTTADTIDNLVALINAGGVTSDVGVSNVSLSTANQRKVQNWVAVDGATYIEVRAKGASYMTVATSEALDVWTGATQLQHCLAGRKKAIDMVIQHEPDVQTASTVSAGKRGTNIMPLAVFGLKTFNQGTNEIFDVQARSDAF